MPVPSLATAARRIRKDPGEEVKVTGSTHPIPSAADAYSQWATLLGLVAVVGVVAVGTLWAVAARRRLRRARARRRTTHTPDDAPLDAWTESARRLDDSITEFDTDD